MKKNNGRRITKNRINSPLNKDNIDNNRRAVESSSSLQKNKKIENVLVLQGGGSLGAFGCGVFKAIANNNIKLDIIAGTSIGGVNAAIIAGSKDEKHPEQALEQFWLELSESFIIGKVSPIHFFWGGFDLAATRFSGRPAPAHPGTPYGARFVDVEAYSHEVSSCGFWPGGGPVDEPVFYAYAYPEPQGFKDYPIQPSEAFYHTGMSEFLLPYDVVRTAKSPDDVLLSFLQGTYEAAAKLANWDRQALERQ